MLEGHISIEAALRAESRPIHRVLIAAEGVRANHEARRIVALSTRRGVPVERLPRAEIDALASGRSHGGMLAEVGERRYVQLAELAVADAFVVMLDGVEDPYNFGTALRSLYAAGTSGLVIRPRSWGAVTAIVARASAGASELLPIALAADPLAAAQRLAEAGLQIAVATDSAGAQSLYAADLRPPFFLLIGGERRGLAQAVLERADLQVRIPYARTDAPSLGTAASAAVIGFEVMRQRAISAESKSPRSRSPTARARRAESDPGRAATARRAGIQR